MKAAALTLIIALSTNASAAERWAVPDPTVTPGAINPAATAEALCNRSVMDQPKPSPPSWVTELELSSYNIPISSSGNYVMDYLIPLSLGGANTTSNVWPQPRAEVELKAALAAKLQLRVCATLRKTPSQAAEVLTNVQRYVAEDWTAAYADYIGH